MRAISLWQPWATLVALELKKFETRSWSTPYRGPIAIHAAKTWNAELEELCQSWPFGDVLPAGDLPRGCIVAVAQLVGCRQATERSYQFALEEVRIADQEDHACEFHFGDFSPGRWLWKLEHIHAITPIPAKGAQGLWQWDAPAEALDLVGSVHA